MVISAVDQVLMECRSSVWLSRPIAAAPPCSATMPNTNREHMPMIHSAAAAGRAFTITLSFSR